MVVALESDKEFREKFSVNDIPALAYKSPKEFPSENATFFCGGLLDTDLAAINNWMYECVGSTHAIFSPLF